MASCIIICFYQRASYTDCYTQRSQLNGEGLHNSSNKWIQHQSLLSSCHVGAFGVSEEPESSLAGSQVGTREFLDLPSHIAGHQTQSRSLTWSFQSSLWLRRLSHSDDWNSYTDNVLWGHSDVWIKAMRISHVWVWAHPPLHVPYQQAPEPHHLNRKMKNFAGIRFPSTPCLVTRQIWKNRRVHEARCPFSSITLSSVCG